MSACWVQLAAGEAGGDDPLKLQDCREAQSRDAKEFAAYFNEGNVQVANSYRASCRQAILHSSMSTAC